MPMKIVLGGAGVRKLLGGESLEFCAEFHRQANSHDLVASARKKAEYC